MSAISGVMNSYILAMDLYDRTMVKVNTEKCDNLSEILANIAEKMDYKPVTWDFPPYVSSGEYDKETVLRIFFYQTAIDHGYWNVDNGRYKHFYGVFDGEEMRGSDALVYAIARAVKEDPTVLEPERMMNLTEEEAAKFLMDDEREWFPLSGQGGDAEVEGSKRLLGRIEILKGAARILDGSYAGKVDNLIEAAGGYLLTDDGTGLLQLLSDSEEGIPGYRDEFMKKAFLFTMYLKDRPDLSEVYQTFEDRDERFMPPIDYHFMKYLLRVGAVEVLDHDLRSKLMNLEEVTPEEERSIRKASLDSLVRILEKSQVHPSVLDNIVWYHGRKVCTQEPECGKCDDFSRVCGFPELMFPIFRTEAY